MALTFPGLIRIDARDASGKIIAAKLPSPEKLRRSVLRVLKDNVLCSIATVSHRNRAYISTAYFCYSDQLELYFLSHPKSTHCKNLSQNSQAAITVFSPAQNWGGPDQGLQLFGKCREAKAAQRAKAQWLYRKRFPQYLKWIRHERGTEPGHAFRFYRFVVSSLKVLDERALGDGLLCRAAVERSAK